MRYSHSAVETYNGTQYEVYDNDLDCVIAIFFIKQRADAYVSALNNACSH